MTVVRLRGLKRVTKRMADGRRVTYVYAWVGGPCLSGQPGQPAVGSPAFIAAYNAALASRKVVGATDTLEGLIGRYKAAPEFQKLAASTKAEWMRWLDRLLLDPDMCSLTFRLLEDRRVRADLLAWRDKWAATPRAADYAVQVLGRVLSWGVDRGLLTTNTLAGVGQLYDANRSDQIWTDDEIARFCALASPEVGRALRLACVTGLRRGDLVKLTWGDIGELSLIKPTSKGKKRGAVAHVPLIDDAVALLAEIGRKGDDEPVLRNTRGKAWSVDGIETMVIKIKAKAKPKIEKHLHDARGTFCTRLRLGGLTADEIASVMGWEKGRVEALLAIYVDQGAFVKSIVGRLRKNESGGDFGN